MRVLTERDLREVVGLDLLVVQCIENAFLALATKPVIMPPILRLDIVENRGEVDVKTAFVPGLDNFAIKISPGFFDNPKIGLRSTNGMMVLLSSKTGLVEALLLDNGYLTNIRTAAAGAVAAKHLAREGASVAAVLGSGLQSKLQLKALMLVRPITEARIWARDISRAKVVAVELSTELGIPVRACQQAQTAVRGADVIITTTPASRPIFFAKWLEAGQHITAMGSDAEHKNELESAVITRADVYVADSLAQTRRLGELHHAIEAGQVSLATEFAEIGEIIAGSRPGRESDSQITIADLTGTGVQDTAIATLAISAAQAAQIGAIFES